MATDPDQLKAAQARVGRLQQALDDVLTGRMRSGLEASTGAGSNRVGYFKPDVPVLQAELARAKAEVARLQGDRSGLRRCFTL